MLHFSILRISSSELRVGWKVGLKAHQFGELVPRVLLGLEPVLELREDAPSNGDVALLHLVCVSLFILLPSIL